MSNTVRRSALIIFLAWLAYLISYLGRADYSACLLEIVGETGAARAAAGMVSSTFSLCNAFGQIASGFILRKIRPVRLIGAELISVAAINLLFPFCGNFALMAVLWGINGCLQSTLLCSVTKIFTETLSEPYLSRGVVLMNTIGAAGGMMNYLISWLIIKQLGWRYVFINVGVLLSALAVIWHIFMPPLVSVPANIRSDDKEDFSSAENDNIPILSRLLLHGTLFVIIGAFFVGLLRESVSLWIPTFMNEVFRLSRTSSVIVTVFVPCLQIAGALLGGKTGRMFRSLHMLSAFAFAVSGICLLTILITLGRSPTLSILLFTLNAISMTAALTYLLSLFPIRYFGHEFAPILVGIINFFVHAGDFVASSGIGLLSETGGWDITLTVLTILAFTASLIMFSGSGLIFAKNNKQTNKE